MEKFIKGFFALIATIVIVTLKVLVRIPVFVILWIAVTVLLLIVNPIHEVNANWVNKLYDWYCGK